MENTTTDIYFKSKKISLIILAVTAIICSRTVFFLFNDPEGPNPIVIAGLALAIYFLSFPAYIFSPFKIKGITRLSGVICIQLLLAIGTYICFK